MQFKGNDLMVTIGKYANGRPAIILTVRDTFEQFAVASVNVPEYTLQEGYTAIKNYSENKGILEALIEHKVVHKPLYYVETPFVSIPICELTDQYKKLYELNK